MATVTPKLETPDNNPRKDVIRNDSIQVPTPRCPLETLPLLDPIHVPYRHAASHILSRLDEAGIAPPDIGIICGSGLSGLSDALDQDALTIPYNEVPGFPAHCTVAGHHGEMVIGTLRNNNNSNNNNNNNKIPTICFRGRFHSYEGHSMQTVVLPVQVMRCLGVKLIIVTNAAGGLKDQFNVGDVAVIRDHIALPLLAGKNPLVGPNDEELGPRFPPTSNLYDAALQDIVVETAQDLGFDSFLHTDGTYAFVSGPQYESKSECAMLKLLGAHAVGMSTVPEILAAHHAGMAVLCLSLITNKVVFFDDPNGDKEAGHANHEEVLEAVKGRGEQMVTLVKEVIGKCAVEYLPNLEELPPICLETKGRVRGELDLNVLNEEEEEENDDGGVLLEEKKCGGGGGGGKGFTMCPYHMVKNVLGAPMHCLVMGGAILAAGAMLGMKVAKRG